MKRRRYGWYTPNDNILAIRDDRSSYIFKRDERSKRYKYDNINTKITQTNDYSNNYIYIHICMYSTNDNNVKMYISERPESLSDFNQKCTNIEKYIQFSNKIQDCVKTSDIELVIQEIRSRLNWDEFGICIGNREDLYNIIFSSISYIQGCIYYI